MKQLIAAISKYINVSENLRKDLEFHLKSQSVQKREILFSAENVCTHSYFIQKGIFRLFYYKDGKDITEFFCAENQWINSPKSFMKQEIDVYHIQAIEEGQVLAFHINDLMQIFDHYPEMERYARLDMGSSFLYLLERMAASRFTSAQEKHQHFLTTYSEFHHRIPLGMAASYIGISQETLSRLRKKHFLI